MLTDWKERGWNVLASRLIGVSICRLEKTANWPSEFLSVHLKVSLVFLFLNKVFLVVGNICQIQFVCFCIESINGFLNIMRKFVFIVFKAFT